MKLKIVLSLLLMSLGVSSCSSLYQKLVYRIDTPQGNYLEQRQVEQLEVGMTQQQVQYLLGTPLLIEPLNNRIWHYVFLKQEGYKEAEQHTLTVTFDDNNQVSNFSLDKPLN